MLCLPGFLAGLFPGAMTAAMAQGTAPATITAGYTLNPPFVMLPAAVQADAAPEPSGLAIDMWSEIARVHGWPTQYRRYDSIEALINAVHRGEADIAVTGLAISSHRMDSVTFSLPWYQTGLRMMVQETRHPRLSDIFQQLAAAGHIRNYLLILGAVILATIMTAIFHRHVLRDTPDRWGVSLSHAFYDVMAMLTGNQTAASVPQQPGARIAAGLWLLCGVGIVAYVTSSITSVMTASEMDSRLGNLADLHGKPAGVVNGGASMAFAHDTGIAAAAFPSLEDAVRALLRGQIAAIIGNAAALEYFDQQHPELPVTEAGPLLKPESLAFAMRPGFALRDPVDRALILLQEQGAVSRLQSVYFGHP